jgi:cullin-associated NEDD8-dissociated protein 1
MIPWKSERFVKDVAGNWSDKLGQAAYETCYTLLDTCQGKLDVHQLLGTVLRGISDDHEIRAICYLMLIRLAQVAPTAVISSM